MHIKRELRYFLLWVFWAPFSALAGRLPIGLTLRAVPALAHLIYPLLGRRRRRMEAVFRQLFPDLTPRDARTTARRTLRNWLLAETENMLQQKQIETGVYSNFPIENVERLDAALARKHGTILLIAHFGAHLQVLPALALRGCPINQLTNRRSIDDAPDGAAPTRPGFFEARYFRAQERRHEKAFTVNMIIAGRFMRPVYACLKRNEVLVAAVDGRQQGSLDSFPFLGYRACPFSNGPVSLASRTGAAIVPAFVIRDTTGANRIVIEEEIVVNPEQDAETGVREGTAAFIRLLEDYVRRFPDHCGMEFFGDGMATAKP